MAELGSIPVPSRFVSHRIKSSHRVDQNSCDGNCFSSSGNENACPASAFPWGFISGGQNLLRNPWVQLLIAAKLERDVFLFINLTTDSPDDDCKYRARARATEAGEEPDTTENLETTKLFRKQSRTQWIATNDTLTLNNLRCTRCDTESIAPATGWAIEPWLQWCYLQCGGVPGCTILIKEPHQV